MAEALQIGWAPVTVQELRYFLEGTEAPQNAPAIIASLTRQSRHPNRAVFAKRSLADAYCNWLDARYRYGGLVRRFTPADLAITRDAWPSLFPVADKPSDSRTDFMAQILPRVYELSRPVGSGNEPPNVPIDLNVDDLMNDLFNNNLLNSEDDLEFPFRCVLDYSRCHG
jgi:hypothetical protein